MATSKFVSLAAALLLSTKSVQADTGPRLLSEKCRYADAFRSALSSDSEKTRKRKQLWHMHARGYLSAIYDKLESQGLVCLPEDMHYLQLDLARCEAYISHIQDNGTVEITAYDNAEKALLAAFPCRDGK